jgi:hypothetical protein
MNIDEFCREHAIEIPDHNFITDQDQINYCIFSGTIERFYYITSDKDLNSFINGRAQLSDKIRNVKQMLTQNYIVRQSFPCVKPH